jgi:hypothetical protein
MKLIQTVFVLTSILLIGQAMPINAQSVNQCNNQARLNSDPLGQLTKLGRAQNLARQAAEVLNGGLGKYRPEASMYGSLDEMNCTVSGDDTWTFTFKGTTPDSSVPYVETAVTVNHQTWQITVDRNTRLY